MSLTPRTLRISGLSRPLGVARSYEVDNPYWYSENNTHVIDRDVIRLQAYLLLNLFHANHGLAYEHRFDDPKDTLGQLHQDFYLSEITRLLVSIAVSIRMFDDQLKGGENPEAYVTFADEEDTGEHIGSYSEGGQPKLKSSFREACNKILHTETVRPLFEKADEPHASCEESDEEYRWCYLTGEIKLTGHLQKGVEWECCLYVPPFLDVVLEVVSFERAT